MCCCAYFSLMYLYAVLIGRRPSCPWKGAFRIPAKCVETPTGDHWRDFKRIARVKIGIANGLIWTIFPTPYLLPSPPPPPPPQRLNPSSRWLFTEHPSWIFPLLP